MDVESFDYRQTASGPDVESHSGDDVVIYARGPSANLFHTTHEQSYIAHVMAYAACVGPYQGEDASDAWCKIESKGSLDPALNA